MSQAFGKFTRTIKLPPAIGDWTKVDAAVQPESSSMIRNVKPANFDSIDRDTMKLAHRIQYGLGELVCKKLSHDMDIKIELHTVTATQMTYSDFVKQSEGNQLIQADLVLGTGDRINLLLDWPLAEQIVNRLTGGSGDACGSSEFTSVEAEILETQLNELVQLLAIPWKNPTLNDRASQFEFSAGAYQINRKVSPRDAYIIFEYELILGFGGIHRLVWAYPNPLIRNLLTTYQSASTRLSQTLEIDDVTLGRSYIQSKVVLGESKIAMGVLANLEEGDIIKLDASIEDPLRLIIGDSTTLHVQPGISNNRLAAQIILWDGPQPKTIHSIKTTSSLISQASPSASMATSGYGSLVPAGVVAAGAIASTTDPNPVDELINGSTERLDVAPIQNEPSGPEVFQRSSSEFEDSSPDQNESDVTNYHFNFNDDTFEEHETATRISSTQDSEFETDDLFSEQYELTHEESDEEVALFGDDDDDFSWDDLENEA